MSSVEKEGKRHRCAEQANKLVLASDTSYFFLQLRQDGPKVMLTGTSQKVPILLFSANPALVHQGYLSGQCRMTFKFGRNDCKLVRTILLAHGFSEVNTASPYFNLLWTGSHILPQHFQPYQKVNHFPSSSELTRKDKFYRNVRHMQRDKGQQHFSIIPTSFVLPEEVSQFLSAFKKWGGVWIVKPVASSRGRGIFLVNHPKQVPAGEAVVVSRYVENPLCIDGLKFDSRLYVAVTSMDPLCIYLYQEGLVRFATVQYTGSNRDLHNQYMHLTNYSVNKNNPEYIRCTDPGLEDFGNKWSFSALLRHLQKEGVDTTSLMMRIEDVIIKSILAAEPQISAACSIAQPYSRNCFELYGFDILIDKNLQPWVLEVNLSPSLACDTPLDLKVKFNLMADLLSLIGLTAHDPFTGDLHAHTMIKAGPKKAKSLCSLLRDLTPERSSMLCTATEENARRGGFLRIFPSEDTWGVYGSFFDGRNPSNYTLHQLLYPERTKVCVQPPPEFSDVITRRLSDVFFPDQNTSDAPNALQRMCSYTTPCLTQPPNLSSSPDPGKRGDAIGSTSDHTPGKREDTISCTSDHTPGKRGDAIGSTSDHTPGKREDTISCTSDHTPGKRGDAIGSTSDHTPGKREDTISCTSDHTPGKRGDAIGSTSDHTPGKRGDTISSTSDHTPGKRGDTISSTSDHTLGKRGDTISSTSDHTLGKRGDTISSTSDHTLGKRGDTISSTSDHTLGKRGDTISSTSDHTLGKRGDTISSTSDHTLGKRGDRNQISVTTCSNKFSVPEHTCGKLSGANGSVVVTNAVSCHTLISGMGTIDPNLGSGSSVVIPHVEQIKTPLCKKLACLEKAAGNLSVYKVRQLFACYMSHVQKRLMADQDRYDQKMKANEDDQGIDVVVQLLRKASRNMKISLDIFVPHHSLPLRYRKKILGRQLLQFIAIFKKETAQYKSADEQSCCPLSPSDFKAFLLEAREPDLEQLLETYAKKSTVSIFCDVPTLSKQLSRVTSAVLVSHDATGNGQLLQPNGSFGSCNCSKSVCQCDVVSHKTQQHLERPMFGLHSQPATPASVASVALMQEYSNGSRQVSHDGLKWLPSHDGRRSYSAVTGQHGDQQQKPIQPDVKTATAHLSKPPASVPVSKKATTPVSRPLPHPLGSNKPAPRCLSAAHSTSRTSAGVLSDSRNSRVLSNGSCIGWHSDPEAPIKRMHSDPEAPIKRMHSDPEASIKRMHSDPEASIKRMHRLSGHSSLQKKVDSGGSVSLETETSGPSHIHERSNDQVGCQPVQLKEGSRRPSPQGLLVQGVTDSSCSTTKGKYEWVECLSPERKEDAHKAENQLKLRAHSEAIAKHLLKDLILTRDNRDPVHLSWSRDFKETLQRS